MSMHKLPGVILALERACDSQIERGNVIPTTNFGVPPLQLKKARKPRTHVLRDALEASDVAIPEAR